MSSLSLLGLVFFMLVMIGAFAVRSAAGFGAVLIAMPMLAFVLPGIINTVVDLFKDTTLVTIIGLFDLLGSVEQALKDPAWLGFAKEGYVFSAVVFFVCCFAMSAYGRSMERRLAKGQ